MPDTFNVSLATREACTMVDKPVQSYN